jgi:hypothetical protein
LKPKDKLRGTVPLFRNPDGYTTDRRWLPSALRRTWEGACRTVGIEVGLYEGTKHAFATDAIRRGVQERHIQAFLGPPLYSQVRPVGRPGAGAGPQTASDKDPKAR